MSDQVATIDPVKRLLRFPFATPDWRTPFLIGTALFWANSIFPLVPLVFVHGYALRIMRQAIAGQSPTLPRWDDWGAIGKDGLIATVVGLIYMLPALIVLLIGAMLYVFGFMGQPLIAVLIDDPGAAAGISVLGFFAGMAGLFGAMFLGLILALAGLIPLPAAVGHALAHDNLGAAFQPRQIWNLIRADAWSYFTAWIIGGGLATVGYVIFMVGYYTLVLICLIPFLVAPFLFYATIVSAAVFGESYRQNAALQQSQDGD